MKKRVLAIPLAGVMLAALAVPALAEENSGILMYSTDTTAIPIQGKYDETKDALIVFSVDIKWGNMKAVYAPNRTEIWNPDTLEVSTVASGGDNAWTWEQSASLSGLDPNEITITNHSNETINCKFDYNPADGFENVTATVVHTDTNNRDIENAFSIKNARLADGTTLDEKLKDVTKSGFVTLTGSMDRSKTSFQTIGTISVTLTGP